jgi:hypothetical protein
MLSSTLKTNAELVQIISSIGLGAFSIVQASFLAYIAYQKWVTNNKKYKLDLYNEKIQIYFDALDLYNELISSGRLNKNVFRQFIKSKLASRYLFSDDISIFNTLDNMHDVALRIDAYRERIDTDPNPDVESTKAFQADLAWCTTTIDEFGKTMTKYLNQGSSEFRVNKLNAVNLNPFRGKDIKGLDAPSPPQFPGELNQ